MSRLSIKNALGIAALVTIVIGFFLVKFFSGHDREMLRDLARDPQVQETTKVHRLLSAGTVVYDRCRTEYGIDAATVDFIGKLAPWVAYSLVKAYEQAYTAHYGKPPDGDAVAVYQSAVVKQQNDAAITIARTIQMHGCRSGQVKKAYAAVENYRQYYAQAQQEKK